MKLIMPNITLITGGTGFIGSHLAEELADRGRSVRCLVKESDNLEHLRGLGAEFAFGDLSDKNSLKESVKGADVVYHLAAIARPMAIPDKVYFEVNAEGTRNLLEACVGENVKKFIHMSSISAVGPSREGRPVSETASPDPIDVYGKSKLEAEKIAFEFIRKYNLPVVLLRPPVVFGPRDFEVLKFFKIIKRRFFPVRENSQGRFEFCYVKNLIQACLLAEEKGQIGEIYHVSNERPYTLKEIKEEITKALGVKPLRIFLPDWLLKIAGWKMEILGALFHFRPPFSENTVVWMTSDFWVSDISKAKEKLGYRPSYSLKDGIEETVMWYKANNLL